MKTIIRKIVHSAGNLLRGLKLIFYRLSGATIGKNTMISLGAKLDVRRGRIIIGDNCLITHGCYILSHDGAAHMVDPNDDGAGSVIIGNHVFIGVNSVVMRNVKIGDHVIIGAGSVVNRDIPEGMVAAGNPVKIIRELVKPYPALPKKHRKV